MTSAAAKLELQGLPDLLQWVDFGTCAVIFLPSCRWLIPLIGQINAPSSASLQVVLTEPCADTVLECAPKYPLNNPKLQSAELVTMRPSAKPPFKRFADAFPFLSKDAGLVIFAGGMEAFDRLSSAQLNALLVNLANDASDGAKAVLLCLGGLSAELKQHILNSRRAVSCAAAIEKQGDHFVWITNFWHAMDHYCDEVTLPLSFDADGRLLIDSENNRGSSLERSDEDVVWSSVPSLQAESAGIPDLRTVADNKAVLAAGLRSAAATLVFRLDSAKDIEPVGRAIFTLRRRGGRLLKIAAVETKTPLRAASLAFLLGCGANIIFENTATCGYIRIMLASLKGVVYSHPLPEHFEEKLAAISASAVIGMVEPARFLSAARAIIAGRLSEFPRRINRARTRSGHLGRRSYGPIPPHTIRRYGLRNAQSGRAFSVGMSAFNFGDHASPYFLSGSDIDLSIVCGLLHRFGSGKRTPAARRFFGARETVPPRLFAADYKPQAQS